MLLVNSNGISCNFTSSPSLKTSKTRRPNKDNLVRSTKLSPFLQKATLNTNIHFKPHNLTSPKASVLAKFNKRGVFHVRHSRLDSKDSSETEITTVLEGSGGGGGGGGGEVDNVKEGQGKDWTTSVLLFALWGVLMYYIFFLAPNQTPSRDMYFLQKLLYVKGGDGFRMNKVLVSVWYIMGLWPLVYSMFLIPTGRSSNARLPVWPFLILSFFGGAYALLPYFVIWNPPPPPVEESELGRWPLNFLESKWFRAVTLAAGFGIFVYACLAGLADWREYYQYSRESKFIHIMSLDLALLSTFAPFWVYNDMTARKWYDKGSWLLPVSLVPFLGPALYLLLRPSLSELPVSTSQSSSEQK